MKTILAVFLIFILSSSAYPQMPDSSLYSAIGDSTIADSIRIGPDSSASAHDIELPPKPFKMRSVCYSRLDSLATSPDTLFKFENINVEIYNGFADVFRDQLQFQIYDFLEIGRAHV